MKNALLFIICFLFQNLHAQQPAYFLFGEDQFKGIQIYDVIQDKKLNYWFATNEGIYHFDYYNYKKIECDKAKGNSVFNFVANKDGVIYCHNLNNQIFRIIDNECLLFYELKIDESSSDISLSIAENGDLIIGAKKIIVLDKNGQKIITYSTANHYVGPPFTTKNNSVQFHLNNCDSILIYEKGFFLKKKMFFLTGNLQHQSLLKFYSINHLSFALDLKTKEQYSYNPSTFELNLLPKNALFERCGSVRIYETGNELWITGTLPGVTVINKTETSHNICYENYFISDVFKDHEGNILLSTFDKGLLIISNTQVQDVIHSFGDDPVTALYTDTTSCLLIGTTKGNLTSYVNGKFSNINNNKGKRPIEAIYGDKKNKLILFDDGHIRAYNKQKKEILNIIEASLKDVAIISENEFYLGTNRGIIKVVWNGENNFKLQPIKEINYRIYSIEYNFKDSCLYASTANGLFVVFPSGSTKKIVYNNEDIFPNYLNCYEDKIYASTKKNGILIIKKDRVIKNFYPIINDKSDVFKKTIIYNNTIISKSPKGLFQFDMNGKLLKSIHSIFGFTSKRVIDFTCNQNQLWVSHINGVQLFDMNNSGPDTTRPIIRFDKILLNNKKTNTIQPGNFKSDQRKIQFIFSSPTLKNRETTRYHYKLIGYDLKWNINNYEVNQITYSALAPGDYTFYVKAENQGNFSEPISYSFSIALPFYARWWFITLVVILFLGIVFMVYRWQLNIQNKKSQQINELNASKLTAIQSQMNPHFIFNSLNSIQDLILKGNVEHSYSYITTFSNLVRRTLSYSEKDFIDFDQEIKLLELYLSLEKLRFKKDFNYSIDFKNVEDIMLPPLLIQPFIENSLIHGLLHKEGQKNLKITFELKDTLICIVEDNGVGREKSKAIKLRQRSEHESFSGKAIHKRFEILSNIYKGNFGYNYEDLYENNEAIGTRVILTIPIKHKF